MPTSPPAITPQDFHLAVPLIGHVRHRFKALDLTVARSLAASPIDRVTSRLYQPEKWPSPDETYGKNDREHKY